MPEDHPTSIRLQRALKADLLKYARAQGCSMTWLIADVLKKWVDWRARQEAGKDKQK